MGAVVVLASPALADGFRLAGAAVLVQEPGPAVDAVLRAVVADPQAALVLVTADLWACLEDRACGEVEQLARPVVMAIPAAGQADPGARRALIADMVRRSIGYRVEPPAGAVR